MATKSTLITDPKMVEPVYKAMEEKFGTPAGDTRFVDWFCSCGPERNSTAIAIFRSGDTVARSIVWYTLNGIPIIYKVFSKDFPFGFPVANNVMSTRDIDIHSAPLLSLVYSENAHLPKFTCGVPVDIVLELPCLYLVSHNEIGRFVGRALLRKFAHNITLLTVGSHTLDVCDTCGSAHNLPEAWTISTNGKENPAGTKSVYDTLVPQAVKEHNESEFRRLLASKDVEYTGDNDLSLVE